MMLFNISKSNSIKNLAKEQIICLFIISLYLEELGLVKMIDVVEKEKQLISEILENQTSNSSLKDVKRVNKTIETILENISRQQFILKSKLQDILVISQSN